MRFEIAGPANATLTGALVISPDGRNLAFLATGADNVSRLWVRALENLESRPLQGTEGADGVPFWSPDSRYIVFQTAQGPRKLHRIEAVGGPPLTLCSVSSALAGGFWTSDNRIIIGTLGGGTLLEVAGGQLKPFTTDDSKDHSDAYPSLLPDGRHFVYSHVNATSPEKGGIYLGTLDNKAEQRAGKRLLADASATVFAASPDPDLGYILFVRRANTEALSGTLMAQPFDNRKLELTSDAVPIAEQVSRSGFSVSASGVLVYGVGALNSFQSARGFGVNGQLTWYDRGGHPLNTVGEPGLWRAFALSPDHTKLVHDRRTGLNTYIWVYDFARGDDTRLTSDPMAEFPVWNADGTRIAFFSAGKEPGIYQRASDKAGEDELLFPVDQGQVFIPYSGGWSSDRRFMLLTSNPAAASAVNLWVLVLNGARAADNKIVHLKSEFHDREGRFSPDNRWFAYISDETGMNEVYIRAFDPNFIITGSGNPSPGGEYRVSTDGGTAPHWSRDGKEIFYMAPNGGIMAVDVSNKFKPGNPKQLFKVPPPAYFLEVADDGQRQRFLIPVAGGTASGNPAPYKVVLNWTSLLKH
jgi:Tol biopolymer transport system component